MSIPRYIVDRQELLAAATVDALDDRQPGDVEVVKFTDHVAAVEAAYLGAVREGLDERERELHDARWRAIDDCIAAVEEERAKHEAAFQGRYMLYDESVTHTIYDRWLSHIVAALRALKEQS